MAKSNRLKIELIVEAADLPAVVNSLNYQALRRRTIEGYTLSVVEPQRSRRKSPDMDEMDQLEEELLQ